MMRKGINRIAIFLKKMYIGIFRRLLKWGKYDCEFNDGTNNFLLNFVNFISLLIYCGLSGYNVLKTFDVNKPPSYMMFTLNVVTLTRYLIANMIIIRDVKNSIAENKSVLPEKVNIPSTKFRIITECLCLCISLVFTLMGRGFGVDIFDIPSVSIVALVSIVIVLFTAMEGTISIGINMFKAKPMTFIALEKEGESKC